MSTSSRQKQEPFQWLNPSMLADNDAVIALINGYSRLMKIRNGAILSWVFNQADHHNDFTVMVHLTNKESQLVYDTPSDVGMLEPVRAQLRDPWALIVVCNELGIGWRRFLIPAEGSELDFVDALFKAAEQTPHTIRFDDDAALKALPETDAPPNMHDVIELCRKISQTL